jgi:RNA recognition motif-containing protein
MLRSWQIMLSFLHCSCQLLGDPQRVTEDLSKKIFVGGLSPSVESDDLWDFFEEKYGPVLDAVVIGSQSGDHLQSRGFGFVTFKHVESVAAAVEAHYINIFGKKVQND